MLRLDVGLPGSMWAVWLGCLLLDVLLLHHYRNTFWLDGRMLVRRLVFGRCRYDLSAALARAIDPGLWHPTAWTLWQLASDPLHCII